MRKVKATELKLGDVVRLYDGAFSDAMVKTIKDGNVILQRPYLARPDFSYTGGVIILNGMETLPYSLSDTRPVGDLIEESNLKDAASDTDYLKRQVAT